MNYEAGISFSTNQGHGDSQSKQGACFKAPKIKAAAKTAFLLGGLAMLLLPSIIWIWRDHQVWQDDQAFYGEVSNQLWFTLRHDPKAWLNAMLAAVYFKPPGITWLGQFFVQLGFRLHHIEFGLLLSVILAQAATLAFVYQIVRQLYPNARLLALAAVIFAASAPLMVALSHQYMVESLQAMCVAYFFWIAVRSPKMPAISIAGHSLIAFSLGLLAKTTTPAYCLFPMAIAAYHFFRSIRQSTKESFKMTKSTVIVLFTGIFLTVATFLWYRQNFAETWLHLRLATDSNSNIALLYGRKDSFCNKFCYWFLATIANFFIPEVAWTLGGLGVAALVAWFVRQRRNSIKSINRPVSNESVIFVASLLQILLVLSLSSLSIPEEHRYLLALLLPITVIAVICARFLIHPLGGIILLCLSLIQFGSVHMQALGLAPKDKRICYWLTKDCSDRSQEKELDRLIALINTPDSKDRMSMCGVELPWLNANTLSFYDTKRMLQCGFRQYITSLGYVESDSNRAWNRLEKLNIAYFITLDAKHLPAASDPFNKVSIASAKRIATDSRFTKIPFHSNYGILVFRHIANNR